LSSINSKSYLGCVVFCSVGLEDAGDLIKDLEQALAKVAWSHSNTSSIGNTCNHYYFER